MFVFNGYLYRLKRANKQIKYYSLKGHCENLINTMKYRIFQLPIKLKKVEFSWIS